MRRVLREPLLHFVLLGALLFAFDALRGTGTARASDDEIVVSRGRIENLAALFTKTWQRPPSALELHGLVDDFVLEEALYREGKALGVDQDDTIIRRRVRQKMEFALDDIVELVEPIEQDLEDWLAEHLESYALPDRYRFCQIYLNPELHGAALTEDALQVLDELRALGDSADPRGLGDPTRLEHAFPDASVQAVESAFGASFAEGLAGCPTGQWSGPLESAYGLHLVRIDGRWAGESRPLEAVREAVERDWVSAQRDEASKSFNEGILERYRVRIEWPVDLNDSQPVQ